jgi:hypothetical protein
MTRPQKTRQGKEILMIVDAETNERTSTGAAYLPDTQDLRQLARSYLLEGTELDMFSFFTGNCEQLTALRFWERFDRIARVLGEEERKAILRDVERHLAAHNGDNWQVYKYATGSAYWSTPPDLDAVLRVADSMPENLGEGAATEPYGKEFLETLQTAREERSSGIR